MSFDKPETKCKTCIGCNKQELENFKEIYRCEYYINYNELKKMLGGK